MAIKKINRELLTKKWRVTLATIILSLALSACMEGFMYKRIGDTDYYITEEIIEGKVSYVTHEINGGFDEVCGYQISDVYWDKKYLLLKCHKGTIDSISDEKVYCIVEQDAYEGSPFPWRIQEFEDIEKYEEEKRRLGLDESSMKHTDSHIPWSLHLFD